MTNNRRKFLKIMGGGAVVAAAASDGFLATRTPHEALAPWQQAGQYEEPRRRALSYAILAPTPHNRQPWQVDLSRDNEIMLYVDTDRLLPHTDPFNRQITIGLGCFLEILRMAAAQDGYRATIENFPQGRDENHLDKRPVARIQFTKDPTITTDPLFEYVLQRRSLKEPFDQQQQVSTDILKTLENTLGDNVSATNDMDKVQFLRNITHDAMAVELATPRTYKESVDLFRIGKSEINANPDGIDFSGPLFETLGTLGLFTREMAMETNSSVYQQGIDAVMANIDTAMGYIWLTSETNTRNDQLAAGRDWVRLNLAATKADIGIHPISQALQEYEEMQPHADALQKFLGTKGSTVQMLGRLGYAEKPAPSPRWALEEKIIKV